MPSLEALSAAVEKAAAALRVADVEVQDDDERKARELAKHVLQVYREHNQKISKVLCVVGSVGSDANSRVLLVLGWALKTADVELQLFSTDPALHEKPGADDASAWCSARSTRLGVQLVLAGDVAPKILEKVRSVTYDATPERGPGFPRALATVQSWEAMGGPQDTTLVDGQVERATLPEVEGFVLGKAFDEHAKFLGEASARATPRTRSPSPTVDVHGAAGALVRRTAKAMAAALGSTSSRCSRLLLCTTVGTIALADDPTNVATSSRNSLPPRNPPLWPSSSPPRSLPPSPSPASSQSSRFTSQLSEAAYNKLVPYSALRRAQHSRLSRCSDYMNDGMPFLFRRNESAAFICLNQKVGSTTWKLALLRASEDPKVQRTFFDLQNSPHGAPATPGCRNQTSAAIPRFMVVRNPYSRLLSAYLDKCIIQGVKLCPVNHTLAREDPIRLFATVVEQAVQSKKGLNDHFSLLVQSHCGLLSGYDYYLPIEQMQYWYGPFVDALGIQSVVRWGWNLTTHWWRHSEECFYHPPGQDCNGAQSNAFDADAPATFHATGSDAHLDAYYNSDLAMKVTKWALPDLLEFGYRPWSGTDGDAYLGSISRRR